MVIVRLRISKDSPKHLSWSSQGKKTVSERKMCIRYLLLNYSSVRHFYSGKKFSTLKQYLLSDKLYRLRVKAPSQRAEKRIFSEKPFEICDKSSEIGYKNTKYDNFCEMNTCFVMIFSCLFLVGAFSLKEKSPTITVSSFFSFSADNLTLNGPLFYNLLFICSTNFLRSRRSWVRFSHKTTN